MDCTKSFSEKKSQDKKLTGLRKEYLNREAGIKKSSN